MIYILIIAGLFIATGLILSRYEERKERRARYERLVNRTRRAVRHRHRSD